MRINKYMHNITVGTNQRQMCLIFTVVCCPAFYRALVFLSEFFVLGSLYSTVTAIYKLFV